MTQIVLSPNRRWIKGRGTKERARSIWIALLSLILAALTLGLLAQREFLPHVPGDGVPDTPLEAHQLQELPER